MVSPMIRTGVLGHGPNDFFVDFSPKFLVKGISQHILVKYY